MRLWKWNYRNSSTKLGLKYQSSVTRSWIDLIAGATTTARLAVKSMLDSHIYPPGLRISDQQMAELRLKSTTSRVMLDVSPAKTARGPQAFRFICAAA